MAFYSEIASVYDLIFPLNDFQLNFVEHHSPVENGRDLIEIGSATGTFAHACSIKGYNTIGLELDHQMIQKARKKTDDVDFREGDMLNFRSMFQKNKFGTIVCFGNTIVHLSSLDAILLFMKQVYDRLKTGGVFMVQFINYDRVIDFEINALPTIANDSVEFVRNYHLISETELHFNTELRLLYNGNTLMNSQTLYPLRRNAFEQMIQQFKFAEVSCYGDFEMNEWSDRSMNTIFICKK